MSQRTAVVYVAGLSVLSNDSFQKHLCMNMSFCIWLQAFNRRCQLQRNKGDVSPITTILPGVNL